MKRLLGIVGLLFLVAVGCETTNGTDDTTQAQIMSGQLKYLYGEWLKAGKPSVFETSKYITSNTAQFLEYTNVVAVDTIRYSCRFAVRSPGRFSKSGVVAITDNGVLL